jgi:hypothetical protein
MSTPFQLIQQVPITNLGKVENHEDFFVLCFQDINTCPGPLEVLNELNREGRSKIGTLRNQINQLEILAKEEVKETERIKLLKEVESHRQQLARWVWAYWW